MRPIKLREQLRDRRLVRQLDRFFRAARQLPELGEILHRDLHR